MLPSFLLRFSILILTWKFKEIKANPNESVAASLFYDAENNDESKVDDRVSKLENEVARLKTKGDDDENQLVGRIERLEASKGSKKECSSAIRSLKDQNVLPAFIHSKFLSNQI